MPLPTLQSRNSFSGTFIKRASFSQPPPELSSSRPPVTTMLAATAVLTAIATAGTCVYAVRASAMATSEVRSDLDRLQRSVADLVAAQSRQREALQQQLAALQSQQLEHRKELAEQRKEIAGAPSALAAGLAPTLEKIMRGLEEAGESEGDAASELAPIGRLVDSIDQKVLSLDRRVFERLEAIEGLVQRTGADSSIAVERAAQGAAAATAARAERGWSVGSRSEQQPQTPASSSSGTVQVTFRVMGGSSHTGAKLYWLGQGPRADGNYSEVYYAEIPRGMQSEATTRPGECWRARDAEDDTPLLDAKFLDDVFCATIEPMQEAIIM